MDLAAPIHWFDAVWSGSKPGNRSGSGASNASRGRNCRWTSGWARLWWRRGGTRRTWLFRAILSHSRKGYSEVLLRQDTGTFLRVIENAVRYFGGVPRLLNFDNLKAAVIKAEWYDPALQQQNT